MRVDDYMVNTAVEGMLIIIENCYLRAGVQLERCFCVQSLSTFFFFALFSYYFCLSMGSSVPLRGMLGVCPCIVNYLQDLHMRENLHSCTGEKLPIWGN